MQMLVWISVQNDPEIWGGLTASIQSLKYLSKANSAHVYNFANSLRTLAIDYTFYQVVPEHGHQGRIHAGFFWGGGAGLDGAPFCLNFLRKAVQG
jgi:hypothetical protein